MNKKAAKMFVSMLFGCFLLFTSNYANPVLTPGVWQNISPQAIDLSSEYYGSPEVDLDPSNPSTLYLCVDMQGLWKTTDGGSTWTRLGTPDGAVTDTTTTYLDSPVRVAVDPANPLHLYATQGVRGNTMGFWVTTDGGAHWKQPPGFIAAKKLIGTQDMTSFDVDPSDFRHCIISSHSSWKDLDNAGILETKDGGTTFIIHQPDSSWPSGTMGVHFLFNPAMNIGNPDTWLVGADGLWRTTDGGATFTRQTPTGVWPDFEITHGGNQIYYAKTGALYTGLFVYPARSTDNGKTWTMLSDFPYASYYSVYGDGDNLYCAQSFADHTNKNVAFYTSPETSGTSWTLYQGGTQRFSNGPYVMRFDKVNRIMYAACWNAGLWALKVPAAGTQGDNSKLTIRKEVHASNGTNPQKIILSGKLHDNLRDSRFYDFKGRVLSADGTRGNKAMHTLRVVIGVQE